MSVPHIEIRDLNKEFRRAGGSTIKPVDNISLSVEADELLVLLGPSGCGKTTLLRCVAGLEQPDSGEIRIDGQLVFSSAKGIFLPPERRNISMVFQSFALWPHMRVGDNVGYPLQSRGVAKADIDKRVRETLDLVGIGGLVDQYPGRISGGQQQRVALARALVSGSNVVLFDEPLSSVDAKVREQLRTELARMQRQIKFSGLYVTHDQSEAMELGHRIAVLHSGRVAALGTPREVYENPPDAYVANFVGVTNIWPAKIAAVKPGQVKVESAMGAFVAERNVADPQAQAGDAVSIIARPEALHLSTAPMAEASNATRVTIDSKIFAGPYVQYNVSRDDCTGRVWRMNEPEESELAVGETVWLSASPKDLCIVSAAS